MRRALLLLLCVFGTGPVWAGSSAVQAHAWVAEYRVHDGQGDRTLVLVRSDDRVEYRLAGEPVRVWENGADGLVHREVFVADGRIVSYTPGDLRALGRNPEWLSLSHLVDPALRAQLQAQGARKVSALRNARAQRYRGEVHGVPVQLDWLDAADLPAQYRSGKGRAAYRLELRTLEQRPASVAFTATDGLREIDYADIGDMELDPFARRYIRAGAGVAAEH
ncbi:hypothetical protein [Lysobacter solisilvae (ex Woo and Kim 2020)]|uniref:DUF4412 domain-containing protein n=1 Tax=Agrilutibacter terrestris TaxID=2865112 RepID=A0A7H0FW13_9GAMM|nr:hypothetical protein [Lysobacter terrestris]QNP40229.1 hypothetical protein H8B22_12140 [Lysobacter terrestris]